MSRKTAITIGNFDGAHVGHQALVRAARELAGDDGEVVVLSFDPHPVSVLRPSAELRRLSRFEQRRDWLTDAGADRVEPLVPTPELLAMSPEVFLEDLVARYRPSAIVEGPDFRFGRDRAGTVDTLAEASTGGGFRLRVIDPVQVTLVDRSVSPASSSLVRWLLVRGRVADAAIVLGRPYELRSDVVCGDKRGREIGMPTANLDHGDLVLPADGIYAGLAVLPDGTTWPAATSVGTKPTFGENPRTCETHLVGYDGPIDDYGWPITLRFTAWVREQLPFESVEALVAQMKRDVEQIVAAVSATCGT